MVSHIEHSVEDYMKMASYGHGMCLLEECFKPLQLGISSNIFPMVHAELAPCLEHALASLSVDNEGSGCADGIDIKHIVEMLEDEQYLSGSWSDLSSLSVTSRPKRLKKRSERWQSGLSKRSSFSMQDGLLVKSDMMYPRSIDHESQTDLDISDKAVENHSYELLVTDNLHLHNTVSVREHADRRGNRSRRASSQMDKIDHISQEAQERNGDAHLVSASGTQREVTSNNKIKSRMIELQEEIEHARAKLGSDASLVETEKEILLGNAIPQERHRKTEHFDRKSQSGSWTAQEKHNRAECVDKVSDTKNRTSRERRSGKRNTSRDKNTQEILDKTNQMDTEQHSRNDALQDRRAKIESQQEAENTVGNESGDVTSTHRRREKKKGRTKSRKVNGDRDGLSSLLTQLLEYEQHMLGRNMRASPRGCMRELRQ